MKERFKYIAAFVLLLGFIFNFAHSELGFMTPEGDLDHHSHDFCQLASAATAKNHINADSFVQKIAKPHLPMVCIIPETAPVSNFMLSQTPGIYYPDPGTSAAPLCVINRTLLI